MNVAEIAYQVTAAVFFGWMAINHRSDSSHLLMWFASVLAAISWAIAGVGFFVLLGEK